VKQTDRIPVYDDAIYPHKQRKAQSLYIFQAPSLSIFFWQKTFFLNILFFILFFKEVPTAQLCA
jgi:hypothetical protein